MKKTIEILLVFCLCIGLCACGQNNEVSLDSDNLSQFLHAKIGPITEENTSRVAYQTIEFYPKVAGNFTNASIELTLHVDSSVRVRSCSGAELMNLEDDFQSHFQISFILPADGYYSIDLECTKNSDDGFVLGWEIENVKGTFTPA